MSFVVTALILVRAKGYFSYMSSKISKISLISYKEFNWCKVLLFKILPIVMSLSH